MKILYSNILPLGLEEGKQTIVDCINEKASQADGIEIAVGYISRPALDELDAIVERNGLTHVVLTIGMYFIEGMPENSYHAAIRLNQKWREAGIGDRHPSPLCPTLGSEELEWQETQKFLEFLAPFAAEHGITMCVENIYESAGSHIIEGPCCNAAKAVKRIDEMNDKYGAEVLGFCFDTGHANLVGTQSI